MATGGGGTDNWLLGVLSVVGSIVIASIVKPGWEEIRKYLEARDIRNQAKADELVELKVRDRVREAEILKVKTQYALELAEIKSKLTQLEEGK